MWGTEKDVPGGFRIGREHDAALKGFDEDAARKKKAPGTKKPKKNAPQDEHDAYQKAQDEHFEAQKAAHGKQHAVRLGCSKARLRARHTSKNLHHPQGFCPSRAGPQRPAGAGTIHTETAGCVRSGSRDTGALHRHQEEPFVAR